MMRGREAGWADGGEGRGSGSGKDGSADALTRARLENGGCGVC